MATFKLDSDSTATFQRTTTVRHRPTLDEFLNHAQQFTVVPVYRRLTCDDLTPVSAYAKIRDESGSFLFESVIGNERQGRYSFLGSQPFFWIEAYQTESWHRLRIRERGGAWTERSSNDPLQDLEAILKQYRGPALRGLPRFCGGAVGYAGYDVVRYQESLPNPPKDDRNLPDLAFAFYDQMLIFDHITKTIYAVVHAKISEYESAESAYHAACDKLDSFVERIGREADQLPLVDVAPELASQPIGRFRSNFAPGGYQQAVRQVIDYILAGDAFQVVLSQRFRTETTAAAFEIYRALRIMNPSPFMFYIEGGPATLIGASPEIMCRVDQGEVVVRPLAGTRRRGTTDAEDQELAQDLLADPKERAEHIMLVDLARNDIGRVAKRGSVKITDLMTVERYSHVMHISSTVVGELRDDCSPFDAMRAALPAGTLSGAPKVRAMEIIDELEPNRRGPYGGAVGYFDFSGNTDTCIALRTLVLCGNQADIQAGAGIVADSDPESEYQETLNKAMSLMRAIEIAETQLSQAR